MPKETQEVYALCLWMLRELKKCAEETREPEQLVCIANAIGNLAPLILN